MSSTLSFSKILFSLVFFLLPSCVFQEDVEKANKVEPPRFAWDTAGYLQKIQKVEYADVGQMRDLAFQLQAVGNKQALLIGKFYEYKADYFTNKNLDWKQNLEALYSELVKQKLYDLVFDIDELLLNYYYVIEDFEQSEKRLLVVADYIFQPEHEKKRAVLINGLQTNYRTAISTNFEKMVSDKQRAIDLLNKDASWSHYHFLVYNKLANTYGLLPDSIGRAYEIFDFIVEESRKANMLSDIADTYLYIALYKNQENKFEEAIEYLKQSIEIYKKTGHTQTLDIHYRVLGHSYMNSNLPKLALEAYNNAIKTAINPSTRRTSVDYAYAGWAIFKIDLTTESYDKATGYFDKAIETSGKEGTPYLMALQRKKWALEVLKRT